MESQLDFYVESFNLLINVNVSMQWRIQDFPDGGGGANFQGGGANLLFGQIFTKNCMKMKEFEPRGGPCVPGATPSPQICQCYDRFVGWCGHQFVCSTWILLT